MNRGHTSQAKQAPQGGKKRSLLKFFRDRSGQTTTEYILMLAIAVMIAMKFKKNIGDVVETATQKMSGKINAQIDGLDAN